MDAFTSATTDYITASEYSLCANLAVLRINPNSSYVSTWQVVLASTTPTTCQNGAAEIDLAGSVPSAGPTVEYFADGLAQLNLYFTYDSQVDNCGAYCSGYWYDAEGFSFASTSDPTYLGWPGFFYTYPPSVQPEPVGSVTLDMNGSAAVAWGVPLPVIGDGSQFNDGIVNSPSGLAANGIINVNYSVSSGASLGAHSLVVSTYAGPSNAVTMNIGDPTPVITSLSSTTWQAGTTFSLTINGTGFGTHPGLTITGLGITASSYSNQCSTAAAGCDTQIVTTLTIAANAIAGTATVTVASNGYAFGSGFVAAQQGQVGSAQATAGVQSVPAPTPTIVLGADAMCASSQSVVGTTQAVFIGQQIAITGCISVPNGLSVASQGWSRPQGVAVGGYNVVQTQSANTGAVVPLPNLNQAGLTYYWVETGSSRQMTFTCTLNNQSTASATVGFNVTGPLVSVTATTGTADVTGLTGAPYIYFGPYPTPGIFFQESVTRPAASAGTYTWVQLITSFLRRDNRPSGVLSCQLPYQLPALDNDYPYGEGPIVSDRPGLSLITSLARRL